MQNKNKIIIRVLVPHPDKDINRLQHEIGEKKISEVRQEAESMGKKESFEKFLDLVFDVEDMIRYLQSMNYPIFKGVIFDTYLQERKLQLHTIEYSKQKNDILMKFHCFFL